MRKVLRRAGYELDEEVGIWQNPATGKRFADEYVEKNHALVLARVAAGRMQTGGSR